MDQKQKKTFKLWPENHRAAVEQKPYGTTLERFINEIVAKSLKKGVTKK